MRCLLTQPRIAGRSEQLRSFHNKFDASAEQLQADFQTRLNTQVKAAEMGACLHPCFAAHLRVLTSARYTSCTAGAKYLAGLPDVGFGLGAFVPGFVSFGEDLLAVTNASLSSWVTLVTNAERPAFERRAAETAQRIDPTGAYLAECVPALWISRPFCAC